MVQTRTLFPPASASQQFPESLHLIALLGRALSLNPQVKPAVHVHKAVGLSPQARTSGKLQDSEGICLSG